MTETERQFRAAGWSRGMDCSYVWYHKTHGTMIMNPDCLDDSMDMWLTGFVAGKESVSPAGEIAGSSETQITKEGDE